MEQLIDLQSAEYLRYWGTEDLVLIELLEDSDLLDSMSADQMGFEDYLLSKTASDQSDCLLRARRRMPWATST